MKVLSIFTTLFMAIASAKAMAIDDARLNAIYQLLNEEEFGDYGSFAKRAEGAFSPAVMGRQLNLLSRFGSGSGARFGGGSRRFGR